MTSRRLAAPVLVCLAMLPAAGFQAASVPLPSLRDPAVSARGDLAVEIAGEIWVARSEAYRQAGLAALEPAVADGSHNRQPAWSADGARLLFSSDRAGRWDIYEAAPGSGEPPRRLTDSAEPDGEPAARPDGALVFVRGAGNERRLWIRETDGKESALTGQDNTELGPAVSPDGLQIAYVSFDGRRRQLRLWSVDEERSRVILRDQDFGNPSWSPDGAHLLFSTGRGRPGVWLTDLEGSFTNLVTARSATAVWPSDADLLLVETAPAGPGYNGDPLRIADREKATALLAETARVWRLRPPQPPAEAQPVETSPAFDSQRYRREALDEVWQRLASLYFKTVNRTRWEALGDEYRRRAAALAEPAKLDDLIYEMLEQRPAARREAVGRAAVSSAHPAATAAGVEMLKRGGNVVDAAVAVSFALGVVEPDASGVGGYGEMTLFLEDMSEPVVIEFLTRVPEKATLDNAALLGDRLPRDGPVVANVPGTVAGMWEAWQRFGSRKLEWRQLLEPAIRLAEEGFVLDDAFPTTLRLEQQRFARYPSSVALFFRDGEPMKAGDTLRNPDLAWTLGQIADGGADAFYKGAVARRMVEDLRGRGNAISETDLSRYFAQLRRPVAATYRGHTVYSSVPAASGGVMLAAKLKLLEQFPNPRRYTADAPTLHAMIEAWKLTPSSRGRVADPNLWPTDTKPFTDGERARRVWSRCFSPDRSLGPDDLRRGDAGLMECEQEEAADLAWGVALDCPEAARGLPCRSSGTTSFAAGDADGNLVAVTQTLGTWGGNFYVTPGLGFLYNDKLRSYGSDPDGYNARLPYARNGTSIAPTLVFSGTGSEQRPLAALGAAGNAWITSAVYEALVGIVDFGLGPQQALELPRFLVGRGGGQNPPVIQVEDGISPAVVRRLRELGHRFQFISLPGELRMGYGSAVVVDGEQVRAGADPRRSGSAEAVK